LRKNEDGLVAFFDADKTSERIGADVEKKIQAIRGDAAIKIAAAELEQATALRTIKDCGETVASIAEATELSAAEVRKLLKLAPASSTPGCEPTPAKLDPEDLPPAALAG